MSKFGDLRAEDERAKRLNARLGLPSMEVNGRGYWRVKGGVFSYMRRKDGLWAPETRMEWNDELIETLGRLAPMPHTSGPAGGL